MGIFLIAAVAGESRVIGHKGALPWHFAADLKHFREKTMGSTLLMGRKTYQSILARLGGPLEGRRTLVLSRDAAFSDARVTVVRTLNEALTLSGDHNLFVTGGADIYQQTLSLADKVYLTRIEKDFEGDAFFPPLLPSQWRLVQEKQAIDEGTALLFQLYDRIKATKSG